MSIISLAAIFIKTRDVLLHGTENFHVTPHPRAITELTPEQRAFVSGGPQIINHPPA
nr:hypothetical protein [uncultured Duganella sp.]